MPKKLPPWVKLTAMLDQDQAGADEWFREATIQDLVRVWFRIQRPHADPVDEIITRMAQNEFMRLALKYGGLNEPT